MPVNTIGYLRFPIFLLVFIYLFLLPFSLTNTEKKRNAVVKVMKKCIEIEKQQKKS